MKVPSVLGLSAFFLRNDRRFDGSAFYRRSPNPGRAFATAQHQDLIQGNACAGFGVYPIDNYSAPFGDAILFTTSDYNRIHGQCHPKARAL